MKERSLSSLVATAAQSKTSRRFYDLSDESSSSPLVSNAKKKSKLPQLNEEENVSPREGAIMVTYARRQVNQIYFGTAANLPNENYSCKFRSFMSIAP